jgi:hypothetical protein
MKTLATADDKAEILRRLGTIGPASERQWGKMTVGEMICHLSDAFRVAMSEKHAEPISNWFTRSVLRWFALNGKMKWPHGVSTVPECAAKKGGTPPAELGRDLRELGELLERFTRRPRAFEFADHAIFGKMSDAEWLRWGYLHMDHHLRQFGA